MTGCEGPIVFINAKDLIGLGLWLVIIFLLLVLLAVAGIVTWVSKKFGRK